MYHPDLEIDPDKATQKVTKIITDNGGKVTKEDNWGKRKLAYKIKGHDHALYVFYTAEIPSESVSKVEINLNITDEVIRFLITKPDLRAIAKAEAFKQARNKKKQDREQAAEEQQAKSEIVESKKIIMAEPKVKEIIEKPAKKVIKKEPKVEVKTKKPAKKVVKPIKKPTITKKPAKKIAVAKKPVTKK